MTILSQIAGVYRRARASRYSGGQWSATVAKHVVPLNAITRKRGAKDISVFPYRGVLRAGRDEWLLSAHHYAVSLARLPGCSMRLRTDGVLEVDTGRFRILATREEELLILHEVLCDRTYHFERSNQSVVIDIGMNVGIAALYFATVLSIPVVGYELVPDTFATALANFDANPHAAELISAVNCGVGSVSGSVEVNVWSDKRGLATIYDRPEREVGGVVAERIPASLVAAHEVVKEVQAQHPNRDLVIKMDCEGAEYDIVDQLIRSGAIDNVKMIMFEWHDFEERHHPRQLVSKLVGEGFTVHAEGHSENTCGMMYAIRC